MIVLVGLIESYRAERGDPINCISPPTQASGILQCAQDSSGFPTEYPASCVGGFYFFFISSDTSVCKLCPKNTY